MLTRDKWIKMGHSSWFIPRRRRIGQHDSSSSSRPRQPLQPRPSWCPFSWDPSWRHLSSSVAVDLHGLLLKPSGSHVRACRGSLWWSIRERCPSHLRRLHLIMSSSFKSAVLPLWLSHLLLCPSRKSPGYFVAICGVLSWATWRRLMLRKVSKFIVKTR